MITLVMKTRSGTELFYNSDTHTYESTDMNDIVSALIEDRDSNDPISSMLATNLLNDIERNSSINRAVN